MAADWRVSPFLRVGSQDCLRRNPGHQNLRVTNEGNACQNHRLRKSMKRRNQRNAFALPLPAPGVILLLVLLLGCMGSEPPAGREAQAVGPPDSRPVVVTSLDLNRLAGQLVCVYNFSSW